MKHYGDVTLLKGRDLPIVDVVTGGSPCQDLSVAGLRKGLKHESVGDDETTRSGLFMDQVRIIKEMRRYDQLINGTTGINVKPRYMVWENVPGAFSSNSGEDFRAVLEETAKISDQNAVIPQPPKGKWTNSGAIMGDGWSIAWRVFDAQFWGVPQRRRRIYLVADFGGESASEILFKREGLPRHFAESREPWQGTPTDIKGSLGTASGFDGYNGVIEGENTRGVVGLDAYNQSLTGNVAKSLNSAATDSDHIPCVVEPVIAIEMGASERDQGNRMWEELSPTLRAAVNNNSPAYVLEPKREIIDTSHADDVVRISDVSPTLQSRLAHECNLITVEPITYCLDQQGGKGGANFTEGVAPTLLSDSHGTPHAVYEWHNQDSRVQGPIDTAGTLSVNAGGREGHLVMDAPVTMQVRSGKEGGGKGALIQVDLSATLTNGPAQTLFEPKAYGISSYESNSMKSSNPHSGVYEAETARTIDQNGGNPACNQGGIMVVDNPTVYSLDRAAFNQGENAQYNYQILEDGTVSTLVSRGPGAVGVMSLETYHCENHEETASTLKARDWKDPQCVNQNKSVRRLTPLECERLQGFPDGWTNIPDYIDSKGKKKTASDSARYKALGNSVALPNVYYTLWGIAEQLGFKGTIGSLFDGIGGFPICWEDICGKGTALWASEIEEYPIAVTKYRFGNE